MTPLIIVPARQFSEGRPCKNREAWPALLECVQAYGGTRILVTDDPWLWGQWEWDRIWLPMGPAHTVATAMTLGLEWFAKMTCLNPVVILQPSSPSARRTDYVRAAVHLLDSRPEASSVVSVVPWSGEPPSKACLLDSQGTLVVPPTPEPRQLQPRHYRRDGTVYAVRRQYAQAGDLYGPRPVPLLVSPDDSVTLD